MARFASLWAALLAGAIYLVSSQAYACDETPTVVKAAVKAKERVASGNDVLYRVDRILDASCICDTHAVSGHKAGCSCKHRERRLIDRLSGVKVAPQLPNDARYDASAGIFI